MLRPSLKHIGGVWFCEPPLRVAGRRLQLATTKKWEAAHKKSAKKRAPQKRAAKKRALAKKRASTFHPLWAVQVFLLSVFRFIKGIILDVDDTLLRSEVLQLMTWKGITRLHCIRVGKTAQTDVELKLKIVEEFFDMVFRKGAFHLLTPGLLYLLTVFKWLPERVYPVWNYKSKSMHKLQRFEQIMGAIDKELRLQGIDACAVSHVQRWETQESDATGIIDPPCPELKAAIVELDKFFSPIRTASMVATISADPDKWILPGVRAFIVLATRLGLKLGLFTSTPREVSIPMLEAAFGKKFLDKHIPPNARAFGGDHPRKPNCSGWYAVAAALGISPEFLIIVDDRPNVILAALDVRLIQKYMKKKLKPFRGAICIAGAEATEDRVKLIEKELNGLMWRVVIVPSLKWIRLREATELLPLKARHSA